MSSGRTLRLFSDVFAIFAILRQHNVPVAIASASPARATAVRLLREFGLSDYKHAVVQPGKKDTHLKSIAAALKAPLRRAMFFDDLIHNIRTAEALGVGGCAHVREGGVRLDDLRRALRRLRECGKGAAMMRGWLAAPPAQAAPKKVDETAGAACAGAAEAGSVSSASGAEAAVAP